MPFDRPPSPASVSRLKCFALHSLLFRADLAWRLAGLADSPAQHSGRSADTIGGVLHARFVHVRRRRGGPDAPSVAP